MASALQIVLVFSMALFMVTSARPNVFKGTEQSVSSAAKARANGYRPPWYHTNPSSRWHYVPRAMAAAVIQYLNTASIMSKSLNHYFDTA